MWQRCRSKCRAIFKAFLYRPSLESADSFNSPLLPSTCGSYSQCCRSKWKVKWRPASVGDQFHQFLSIVMFARPLPSFCTGVVDTCPVVANHKFHQKGFLIDLDCPSLWVNVWSPHVTWCVLGYFGAMCGLPVSGWYGWYTWAKLIVSAPPPKPHTPHTPTVHQPPNHVGSVSFFLSFSSWFTDLLRPSISVPWHFGIGDGCIVVHHHERRGLSYSFEMPAWCCS